MSPQTETTKKFVEDARSLREQVTATAKWIQDYETNVFPTLIKSIGKNLDEIKVKTDFMAEWMDALVGVVGVEKVEILILETRQKKAMAEAERQQAALAAEKAAGTVVAAEKIDDDCFVVLSEIENETQKPVQGGWFKLHVSQLKPELREILKDKVPGYTEKRENTTFTLMEILKAVPPAVVEV